MSNCDTGQCAPPAHTSQCVHEEAFPGLKDTIPGLYGSLGQHLEIHVELFMIMILRSNDIFMFQIVYANIFIIYWILN